MSNPLPVSFYERPTVQVAREILGARLVCDLNGERITGIITEAEAYVGETDLGCHAKAGRTKRTEGMYGPAGRAYIYFTYGMHWMLCVVTEVEGFPAAVLIRAVEVEEGWSVVRQRRGNVKSKDLTNGPAKLTQAFGLDIHQHKLDLTKKTSQLWIEPAETILDENVTIGQRVGLYSVPEPWKSMPWRFLVNR